MNKLTIAISPEILTTFPALSIVCCRAHIPTATNLTTTISSLSDKLKSVAKEINNIDPITLLPEIACWRDAYGKIGLKPSKYHSSIEALLRRIKKGQDIATGLPIVDFYNLISLTEKAPIGAYDATKFTTPEIIMRYASPNNDKFDPLGGQAEAFPILSSLAVYASGTEIMCWGFNTRDSKAFCVDANTQEVLFFSETTDADLGRTAISAIQALAACLEQFGIATSSIVCLSHSNPSTVL